MKNLEGEGNRKDGEGQRGESLQDGRETQERQSCVPFAIFERSRGTRAEFKGVLLIIGLVLHKD